MNHSIYGLLQKYRHKHENVQVHKDTKIKKKKKSLGFSEKYIPSLIYLELPLMIVLPH